MHVELKDFDLAVKSELRRIAALGENWDSEGARPIAPNIIDAATDFISVFPARLKSLVAVPEIVPMRKGNLQFEWHDGPKTLELEIEDARTIHYLKWHSEAGVEEEDVCPLSDSDTVTRLIEWFAKG
jgi:hypothetical protein